MHYERFRGASPASFRARHRRQSHRIAFAGSKKKDSERAASHESVDRHASPALLLDAMEPACLEGLDVFQAISNSSSDLKKIRSLAQPAPSLERSGAEASPTREFDLIECLIVMELTQRRIGRFPPVHLHQKDHAILQ